MSKMPDSTCRRAGPRQASARQFAVNSRTVDPPGIAVLRDTKVPHPAYFSPQGITCHSCLKFASVSFSSAA